MHFQRVLLRLGAALLLSSPLAAQAARPARSTLLGVTMPDSTTLSGNFLYREAAKATLKRDAVPQAVTLGQGLELFKLPMSGPSQADIVSMIQRAGWTIAFRDSTPTIGIADKAGAASVLLSFITSRKDRWLYAAEIAQRQVADAAPSRPAAPAQATPSSPATPAPAPVAPATPTPATPRAPAAAPAPSPAPTRPGNGTFAFSTTNYDDGWTATIGDAFVQVRKGDMRVIQHYRRAEENTYMSVLEEQTRLFWNLLVAPRYRDVQNMVIERNNPGGYEPVNYAEATATEIESGRRVFIVLFNHPNRKSHWMEFVTPDKATFEREFGPYRSNDTQWNRWLAMAGRNRFAVAPGDFNGEWSDSFGAGTSMVYVATGRSAGMLYSSGSTVITFDGSKYLMQLAGSEGMVGSLRTRTSRFAGTFTVVDQWHVAFSNNFEGQTRRFQASFEGVEGGRVLNLVLDEPGNGITLHLVRVR